MALIDKLAANPEVFSKLIEIEIEKVRQHPKVGTKLSCSVNCYSDDDVRELYILILPWIYVICHLITFLKISSDLPTNYQHYSNITTNTHNLWKYRDKQNLIFLLVPLFVIIVTPSFCHICNRLLSSHIGTWSWKLYLTFAIYGIEELHYTKLAATGELEPGIVDE